MSGPTRSELERRIENLETDEGASESGESAAPIYEDDETQIDRWYPDEELRQFVLGVGRNILTYTHDREVANSPRRERVAAVVEKMREEYDIEENRDEAVIDSAVAVAERENKTFATDVFLCVLSFPEHFNQETREKFDRLFENGEREAAASMMVRAMYDILAEDPCRS